ncbi:MAG: hypothetical protein ABS68_07690 [Niastella sp. SCN 39-18]|nr:MAG: hypothetical protein ABS68_07690 [Niastella sp. SCN 39-18]OJW11601.1 MAG: hypothetical protein BGO53_11755 [Sphingobacteriales bacterium 39-19]
MLSYSPPKGYTHELKESAVRYTFINKKDKSWSQIGIFKSTLSKGSLEAEQEKAKKKPAELF